MTYCVFVSASDPDVIFKNRIKSFVAPLPELSAIFEGNDTAALQSWEVNPTFSDAGSVYHR